jgi:Icc-related predicted phosphoesterase
LPILDKYRTVPFLPVMGNHDVNVNGAEYRHIFGPTDYVFDYGQARFIIVDDIHGISTQQLAWIEKNLAGEEQKRKFVFAHTPPDTIEKWAYHSFSKGSDALCDLLSKHKVDMAFFGHIHAYSAAVQNGVEYVVTGGGGAPLSSRFRRSGNVHHYCVVHVDQHTVSHEVVRLMVDGSTSRSPGGNTVSQASSQ